MYPFLVKAINRPKYGIQIVVTHEEAVNICMCHTTVALLTTVLAVRGSEVRQALEKEMSPYSMTNFETVACALIAGGIAGGIVKTLISPLDISKRDYYAHHLHEPYSLIAGYRYVREKYDTGGLKVLFTGNMYGLVRIIPYAGLQFAANEQWKRILNVTAESSPLLRVTAGALAGMTSLSLIYPIDITLSLMNLGTTDDHSIVRSIQNMWHSGGILAFYRGYVPSIIGIIPYAGISFGMYGTLKPYWKPYPHKVPSIWYMACGAVSGLCAQTVSYPFDVVRRHMMFAKPGDERYRKFIGTVKTIYQEMGWKGFYRGLSMNWVRAPVATGLSYATFDKVMDVLQMKMRRKKHSIYGDIDEDKLKGKDDD